MINNMVDIRIKSLKNTSFDELFEAFRQAFAEYEMQLNRAELQAMLKRRGFDPEFSFAAFDGDKIVSFTCQRDSDSIRHGNRNIERLPGNRVGNTGV